MKLLIVEDDADGAAYLTKALVDAGHTVDQARTGREGLLLAASEMYDVIVLDRMLPQLDGHGKESGLTWSKTEDLE